MSEEYLAIPRSVRDLGVHIAAARGHGKSQLIGSYFVPQDILQGIPTIVIDPIGETINYILSKIARLKSSLQEEIWPHITYIDLAGRSGYVSPFPLYYRLGNESLYEIAQRPL